MCSDASSCTCVGVKGVCGYWNHLLLCCRFCDRSLVHAPSQTAYTYVVLSNPPNAKCSLRDAAANATHLLVQYCASLFLWLYPLVPLPPTLPVLSPPFPRPHTPIVTDFPVISVTTPLPPHPTPRSHLAPSLPPHRRRPRTLTSPMRLMFLRIKPPGSDLHATAASSPCAQAPGTQGRAPRRNMSGCLHFKTSRGHRRRPGTQWWVTYLLNYRGICFDFDLEFSCGLRFFLNSSFAAPCHSQH